MLDVNYGGSTGYGRAYRNRLRTAGASSTSRTAPRVQWRCDQGRADPARLIVKGGSAGGYTTLGALTAATVFQAGISQYGISDLESWPRTPTSSNRDTWTA